MTAVHFDSYTAGRAHLATLLDAAKVGTSATARRGSRTFSFVDAERFRQFAAKHLQVGAQALYEADAWSIFIPGLPVAADGPSFDDAINEMINALREYADDWQDHLRTAANHQANWGLVLLIALSSDDQLRRWLVGATDPSAEQA